MSQTPNTPASPAAPAEKPMITYDDFAKLDIRVAKVLEIRDHPNADKLTCLTIDIGGGQTRQIIAGIRGHYSHEELLDKLIIVLVNLQPRKMRGLESNGMLLAATCETAGQQKVILLIPDSDLPPGSSVS